MEATKNLKEICALWRKTSKKGNHYFEGYGLKGFYVGEKQNPNEPDLRIYKTKEDDSLGDEYLAMWVNESKSGSLYLTGKLGNLKVVGFISKEDTTDTKKPYLNIFARTEEAEQSKPVEEVKPVEQTKAKTPGKKF